MSTTKLSFNSNIQPIFLNNAQLQLQLSKDSECSISQELRLTGLPEFLKKKYEKLAADQQVQYNTPYPVPYEIDNGVYKIPLMTATCSKTDSSGMCSVTYNQGGHNEKAVLPCFSYTGHTGKKINLSVVHAKCAEDGHELSCEYQYLPSMARDCDGPNACK